MGHIEFITKGQAILWQQSGDGVGEPAIYFRRYSDVLQIQQEDTTINLSPESLNEFIRALRTMDREAPK